MSDFPEKPLRNVAETEARLYRYLSKFLSKQNLAFCPGITCRCSPESDDGSAGRLTVTIESESLRMVRPIASPDVDPAVYGREHDASQSKPSAIVSETYRQFSNLLEKRHDDGGHKENDRAVT